MQMLYRWRFEGLQSLKSKRDELEFNACYSKQRRTAYHRQCSVFRPDFTFMYQIFDWGQYFASVQAPAHSPVGDGAGAV